MEAFKIQINVTLDLSDKAVQLLQALTGAKAPAAPAEPEHKPEPKKVETKPAPKPEVKEDPVPEAPAAPAAEPEAPAEITDESLRALIKEVRTATSPAAVRSIFNEFGIKTSIECPMERRAELVDRLKKLAA